MEQHRIHRLHPDVIHRIAAGEVIQRPSAALKELMENCIDAGAQTITITSSADGGLTLLEVCDDGEGVQACDFPLLCERHATSKLNRFEDLHAIESFGFRGEAMAAMSYASKVTVISRRQDSAATEPLAYLGVFTDGRLTPHNPPYPHRCAAPPGTTVRLEHLFSGSAQLALRKRAHNPVTAWSDMVVVVRMYALAFPHVCFRCTRRGNSSGRGSGGSSSNSAGATVIFPGKSTMWQHLRVAYGSHVAAHARLLYHLPREWWRRQRREDREDDEDDDDVEGQLLYPPTAGSTVFPALGQRLTEEQSKRVFDLFYRCQPPPASSSSTGDVEASTASPFAFIAYTTDLQESVDGGGSGQQRSGSGGSTVSIFINRRLVDHAGIRRAITQAYSSLRSAAPPSSSTGSSAAFYTVLLLAVPGCRVDVNVHPTKREVALLDEELILRRVSDVWREGLHRAAEERQMNLDSLGASAVARKRSSGSMGENGRQEAAGGGTSMAGVAAATAMPPAWKVRVEPQRGAMERFLTAPAAPAAPPAPPAPAPAPAAAPAAPPPPAAPTAAAPPPPTAAPPAPPPTASVVPASLSQLPPSVLTSTAAPTPSSGGGAEDSIRWLPASPSLSSGSLQLPGIQTHDDENEDEDDVMKDFKRSTVVGAAAATMSSTPLTGTEQQQQDGTLLPHTVTATSKERSRAEEERTEDGRPPSQQQQQELLSFDEVLLHGNEDGDADSPPTECVLSSIRSIIADMDQACTPNAAAFQQKLVYVGTISAEAFLLQVDLHLIVVDTRRLLHSFACQLIFRRWALWGGPRSYQYGRMSKRRQRAEGQQSRLSGKGLKAERVATRPDGDDEEEAEEVQNASRIPTRCPAPALLLSPPADTEGLLYFGLAHGLEEAFPMPPSHQLHALLQSVGVVSGRRGEKPSDAEALIATMEMKKVKREERANRSDLVGEEEEESRLTRKEAPPPPPPLLPSGVQAAASRALFSQTYGSTTAADGDGMPPAPLPATQQYVRRLLRRLRQWQPLLHAYFGIELSEDGRQLVALPQEWVFHPDPQQQQQPQQVWDLGFCAALLLLRLADAVRYPTPAATCVKAEREGPPSSQAGDDTLTGEEAAKAEEEEMKCFHDIASHIASFHVEYSTMLMKHDHTDQLADPDAEEAKTREAMHTFLSHHLVPVLQQPQQPWYRLPAEFLSDGTIQHVVSVDSLYKVFERC